MALRWPDKDPDELLDYTVDWSRYLDTLTIASVEWRYVFTEDVTISTVLRKKGTESDALSASSNIDTKGDDDPTTSEDESNPVGGLIVNSIPTPTSTTASIVLQGGVANKDYPAASIANSVRDRMLSRGVITEDQLITIYKSQTFPTTGYGTVYNLHPDIQAKVQEAFFSFEWEGTSLEEEFSKSNEGQFLPMTYQVFWEVIRKIDSANGVSYACE